MAQELLQTFDHQIEEIALRPGTGGVYNIFADDKLIYSRQAEGRMPEITELKQLVRDRIAPDKPLGHSDKKAIP